MSNILLISDNQDFSADLIEQIKLFDAGFDIFTDSEENVAFDMVIVDEKPRLIRTLVAKYPKTPLILLAPSDYSVNSRKYKTIKKPINLNDFLLCISSCGNLLENSSAGYLQFGNYELMPAKKEIICLKNSKSIKLTEKEVSILKYLYKAKDRLVYKNELLQEVWNYNAEVSTHTLETHIYRLRQKVEKYGQSPLIITKDSGYQLKF